MTKMNFVAFADKWQPSTRTERDAAQEQFIDLCDVLNHPTPVDVDPDGNFFAFEKDVIKITKKQGRADAWKLGHFVWEYKSEDGASLDNAYVQAQSYRPNLGSPPLVVVSNMKQFRVHTDFNGTLPDSYDFDLEDLRADRPVGRRNIPAQRVLYAVFYEPDFLRPDNLAVQLQAEQAFQRWYRDQVAVVPSATANVTLNLNYTQPSLLVPPSSEAKLKRRSSCLEQPPGVDNLLPRNEAIKALADKWGKRPVAAILGIGGQGKTSFAALYAKQWSGTVYWATVGRGGEEIITCALHTLGVEFERGSQARSGELAFMLVNHLSQLDEQWLLVIDDIEPTHLDDQGYLADPELRALLDLALRKGLGRSRLLLTARALPSSIGANKPLECRLDGLQPEQGVKLIKTIFQRKLKDEGQLLRVAGPDYTDGNPYALVLLANLLEDPATGSPDRTLMKLLTNNDIWNYAVAELLLKVWQQLPSEQHRAAKLIALFPRPVEAEVIAGMLAHLPKPQRLPEEALANLVRRSLADLNSEEQYELHPLLSRHAYKQWMINRNDYHLAAAKYYLTQYKHQPIDNPPTEPRHVQPLLERFDHLCAAEAFEQAAILLAGGEILEQTGTGQRYSLHDLLMRWGEYRRLLAMYERLMSGPKNAHTKVNSAVIAMKLGGVYEVLGHYQRALGCYQQALDYAVQANDKMFRVEVEISLAATMGVMGSHQQALDRCTEVLAMLPAEDLGYYARVRHIQGLAYHAMAEHQTALKHYKEAQSTYEQLGYEASLAELLLAISNIYSALADYPTATSYWQQAWNIIVRDRTRSVQGYSLNSLAIIYIWQGRYQEAVDLCEQALALAEQRAALNSQAGSLINLGLAHSKLNKLNAAINYYERAVELVEITGDVDSRSIAYANLGYSHQVLDQTEPAVIFCQNALQLTEQTGNAAVRSYVFNVLGQVELRQGNVAQAISYHQQAIAIFERAGMRRDAGQAWHNLAQAQVQAGELTAAFGSYLKARKLKETIADPELPATLQMVAEVAALVKAEDRATAEAEVATYSLPDIQVVGEEKQGSLGSCIYALVDGANRQNNHRGS